jgi:hypothetical protein
MPLSLYQITVFALFFPRAFTASLQSPRRASVNNSRNSWQQCVAVSRIQFPRRSLKLTSNKVLLGCVMLAVVLLACPICIVALFGFARHVDPQTGHFKR